MSVEFNPAKGELLKEEGHENALRNPRFEERVQAARRVAKKQDEFTTDDVWAALGSVPAGHNAPSAMGSVMRFLSQTGEIKFTGRFSKSQRPEQHRKLIRLWRAA